MTASSKTPLAAASAPPVQRAMTAEPETPAAAAVSVPAGTAAPTTGAAAAPSTAPDPAELADQLYDHIAGRLRRELLVERERSGLLLDR